MARTVLPFYGTTGKFTWRMGATVLGAQSLIVFLGALVARGIAAAGGDGTSSTYLVVGTGLAVLCMLAAGMMRRPYGVTLGWVIQLATFLCGFAVGTMVVVGVIFTALWVLCLWQGTKIDAEVAARTAQPTG